MDRRRIHPPGFIEPCIPTLAAKPPFGSGWVHEIKHGDGYRLLARRELFTRRVHDWTDRYPAIVAVAAKLRAKPFSMHGEPWSPPHRAAPRRSRLPIGKTLARRIQSPCGSLLSPEGARLLVGSAWGTIGDRGDWDFGAMR
jgi:hypothetical protein